MFEMAIVLVKTKILAALQRPHENLSEKSLRLEMKFPRTVSSRIEHPRENSLRADQGKHHLNFHVDLPVFS